MNWKEIEEKMLALEIKDLGFPKYFVISGWAPSWNDGDACIYSIYAYGGDSPLQPPVGDEGDDYDYLCQLVRNIGCDGEDAPDDWVEIEVRGLRAYVIERSMEYGTSYFGPEGLIKFVEYRD